MNTARQFCHFKVSNSQFEKPPVKVQQGMIVANYHVFSGFKDSEESQKGLFFIGAAVVWALEPLGMTICIYIC